MCSRTTLAFSALHRVLCADDEEFIYQDSAMPSAIKPEGEEWSSKRFITALVVRFSPKGLCLGLRTRSDRRRFS